MTCLRTFSVSFRITAPPPGHISLLYVFCSDIWRWLLVTLHLHLSWSVRSNGLEMFTTLTGNHRPGRRQWAPLLIRDIKDALIPVLTTDVTALQERLDVCVCVIHSQTSRLQVKVFLLVETNRRSFTPLFWLLLCHMTWCENLPSVLSDHGPTGFCGSEFWTPKSRSAEKTNARMQNYALLSTLMTRRTLRGRPLTLIPVGTCLWSWSFQCRQNVRRAAGVQTSCV